MDTTSSSVADPKFLQEIGLSIIHLMGFSFILGVLVTVFLLLILDMMRVRSQSANQQDENEE